MAADNYSAMDKLRIADPDTYVWVKGRLGLVSPGPSDAALSSLVEATIWGLSLEAGLGEAVAKGALHVIGGLADDRLDRYIALVRRAAETGPTLGRIMATYLAPVVLAGDTFLARFQKTIGIMLRKGTYTLTAPLEVMAQLLSEGDEDAASTYLDLLGAVFAQEITYNQSLRLVHLIPRAVSGFPTRRRNPKIRQLHRVALVDLRLVDSYLDGLEKGSRLLDERALDDFVGQALERHAMAAESALKFLSLSSKAGKEACAALARAVALSDVKAQLDRYLHARLGKPVTVKSLTAVAEGDSRIPWVCADGRHIFLPEEIDCHPTQDENLTLYKALSRMEAGYFECRTFDFDLEKAADRHPEVARVVARASHKTTPEPGGDGRRFIRSFFPDTLAADLFDIFEQGRVARHCRLFYPGLMRQVIPMFRMMLDHHRDENGGGLLGPVFVALVLGKETFVSTQASIAELQRQIIGMWRDEIDNSSKVEESARLVCLAFDLITRKLGRGINQYTPMDFPFDRRLRWDLVDGAFAAHAQTALRIKMRLKEMGVEVYASDLRNRLAEQNGLLAADDIAELVLTRFDGQPSTGPIIDISELDLDMAELLRKSGTDIMIPRNSNGDAVRYPEWALHLQDYLYDHTLVYDKEVSGDLDGDWYSQILARYRGLLANMRRAFELLKPEGLALLRQWPEGDAFDYRAMIDFVMDRRAGHIPSDRLFIKRLKQERDVAVMLLVDLSRSTANPVAGGRTTVLDVAKEALVLFCEALEVVGDDYAIAGFSGTGRHSVDFYRIKGFHEALSDTVRSRISSLRPHRSTRMGAAIRHAAALLAGATARVKLLMVVSDGFPNDIGYKSDYAIADTCRSIQEARSRSIHAKAITVNIGSDPRLDDLYGRNHHHVIGDVRELPDKLVRLYGALTRF